MRRGFGRDLVDLALYFTDHMIGCVLCDWFAADWVLCCYVSLLIATGRDDKRETARERANVGEARRDMTTSEDTQTRLRSCMLGQE